MNAATYNQPGDLPVLNLLKAADLIGANNKLLINMEALNVEEGDLLDRKRTACSALQDVIGCAAAGEILKVGNGVGGNVIGEKATTFVFTGFYVSLCAAPLCCRHRHLAPAGEPRSVSCGG
ncbi:hypothetical protein W822_22575 [Advenella kashmirensis W13003]|uniref:Uncharacterized protein n=1 Tax=Advenella kashmirensis W13003 TaxID=1424334 RepID=V8QKU8_9BURK|nr:hypothetical protein [Advenella kashmirensis]ETF00561.1 hypothetical protein W822_22575 [Advenella kashmirensis W13003]